MGMRRICWHYFLQLRPIDITRKGVMISRGVIDWGIKVIVN